MFIVSTQVLENYGAHSESGKFADGQNYWKFKFGDTYLVEDLDREQDAMAFVAARFIENSIGWKEFPIEVITHEQWQEDLAALDEDYREFLTEQAIDCTPLREAA